jgi:hypothetical protein
VKKPKYADINPLTKLHPGEPYFFVRAQDRLSVEAVKHYAVLLQEVSERVLDDKDLDGDEAMSLALTLEDQAAQVADFALQFIEWQKANPDKVKLPD